MTETKIMDELSVTRAKKSRGRASITNHSKVEHCLFSFMITIIIVIPEANGEESKMSTTNCKKIFSYIYFFQRSRSLNGHT